MRNSLIIIDLLLNRPGNKTCVQNNLDGKGNFKSTSEAGFALAEGLKFLGYFRYGSFLSEASRICPVNTQVIRERVTGSMEKVLKRYFDLNGN